MLLEITDTFGGEANYNWVKRFIIDADFSDNRKLLREARKIADINPGVKLDLVCDSGDFKRWNFRGSCICLMISWG